MARDESPQGGPVHPQRSGGPEREWRTRRNGPGSGAVRGPASGSSRRPISAVRRSRRGLAKTPQWRWAAIVAAMAGDDVDHLTQPERGRGGQYYSTKAHEQDGGTDG